MPTILITGANRGLGLEIAKEYLADGWKVIACCRNPDKAGELKKISDKNLQIEKVDVADVSAINALAQKLKNEKIDILMNNAGVYNKLYSPDEWLDSFKINTIAPYFMIRAFQSQVAASELKIIANMSSLMGSMEEGSGGSYDYRASKAALNSITKSLAVDLKSQNIKLVALSPGWVRTDMGGSEAPLSPQKSINGIKKVLANLKMTESGSFINYDGEKLPW